MMELFKEMLHGKLFNVNRDFAEYEPLRRALRRAGLNEKKLRRMDPDDRVAALEQARLDPYDYIYLAC